MSEEEIVMPMLPLAALMLITAAATAPAAAQPAFTACQSQQELQQVLQSGGQIMPDGCRNVVVASAQTPDGELCQLEFQMPADPGVVERLTEAATPSRWWVDCDVLVEAPTP